MLAEIIPLVAGMQADEDARPYRHSPSNAGPQKCIRQSVYHALKVPRQPLAGRAALVFDDGSWHEELTLDWIRKSPYSVHSQQMNFVCGNVNGVDITGSIDSVIAAPDGEEFLLEHKAINHFTFQRFEGNEDQPKDYYTQVALYLKGLAGLSDIRKALLLIKNKNTAQYMEYLLAYNTETDELSITGHRVKGNTIQKFGEGYESTICQKAIHKFEVIDEYVGRKTLPPRQYSYGHWRCDYCSWGRMCWEGYQEEHDKRGEVTIEDEAIAEMMFECFHAGSEKRAFEKMEKDLKEKLTVKMGEMNAKVMLSGEYSIESQVKHRKGYTVKDSDYQEVRVKRMKGEIE